MRPRVEHGHEPIDREAIRLDLSLMAFREIAFDRSLNLDYELAGDEIQSLFERLCTRHGIDADCLWREIAFDRYFCREFNLFEFLYAWIRHARARRGVDFSPEPFFVDDLVVAMERCRSVKA